MARRQPKEESKQGLLFADSEEPAASAQAAATGIPNVVDTSLEGMSTSDEFDARTQVASVVTSPPGDLLYSSEVPKQAAGIPYQILYAALMSMFLAHGEELGIEHLDDISVTGPQGQRLIQVKNEASNLTDLDKGLWGSLARWAKKVKESPGTGNRIPKFVFATTAPITDTFPLHLLHNKTPTDDRVNKLLESLPGFASADTKIQDCINIVRGLDPNKLRQLFWNVHVEQLADVNGLTLRLTEILRDKTFPEKDCEEEARRFKGWFSEQTQKTWAKGQGARFTRNEVLKRLEKQRNQISRSDLVYRHAQPNISPAQESSFQNKLFYRQLQQICPPSAVLRDAVLDYLRNKLERSDWVDEIEVFREELESYDNELFETWQRQFPDIAGRRSKETPEQNGRELYVAVMNEAPRPLLNGQQPLGYVYRGSYHELAEAKRLGWHPEWEQTARAYTSEGSEVESVLETTDE